MTLCVHVLHLRLSRSFRTEWKQEKYLQIEESSRKAYRSRQ